MLESPKELAGLLGQLEQKSRQNPDDIELLQRLARLSLRNGNEDEAARIFERIIKNDPQNAQIMVELADCLIRRSAYNDAQFYLDRALEIRPGFAAAFITLSRMHEALGVVDKQVSFMMLAANAAPDKPEVRLALAELLKRYGDFNGAVRQYRQVLEIQPDIEPALFSLGTLLMKQGEFSEAMRQFRSIINNNPGAFDAHFNLATCLFRQRKYAMAANHFKMAVRKPELADRAMYLMAQCHFKQGNFDHAIVVMEKLVESDEKNISYHKCLAEIYEAAKEHDLAAEVYRRLSHIAPERAEFMIKFAQITVELADYEKAEKSLEVLFKAHPGHVEGHRILGDIHAMRGSYKSAIEEYRHALMINENYAEVFAALASVYRKLENQPEEHAAMKRAVELGVERPELLLRLGELERILKLPASLDRFKRITELAPDSSCAKEAEYYIRHKAA
ncbi:MAG: tetratricopeptide repeat protein [Erysipelotrichia bacterium]|nr:tetratricopeptide repeat protein [Erysipelotrichia bacterium]